MQSNETVPVYQRGISVRTAEDETFELLLQAPKKQNSSFGKNQSLTGWIRSSIFRIKTKRSLSTSCQALDSTWQE
jgi:hypothetical protein